MQARAGMTAGLNHDLVQAPYLHLRRLAPSDHNSRTHVMPSAVTLPAVQHRRHNLLATSMPDPAEKSTSNELLSLRTSVVHGYHSLYCQSDVALCAVYTIARSTHEC